MAKRLVQLQHKPRFEGFGLCEMANIDPDRNRKRYYCISLQPGLFDLILERQWGRLGGRCRVKHEFCQDISQAVKRANQLYRQRILNGYKEF